MCGSLKISIGYLQTQEVVINQWCEFATVDMFFGQEPKVKRENCRLIGAVRLGSPTYRVGKQTGRSTKKNRVFKKKLGFCFAIS